MWLPKKRIWIQRSKIVGTAISSGILGGHFLEVDFVDEDGETDTARWSVRNPSAWARALGITAS